LDRKPLPCGTSRDRGWIRCWQLPIKRADRAEIAAIFARELKLQIHAKV
jgi:hypothetical protein